jgi:hypothetical protein
MVATMSAVCVVVAFMFAFVVKTGQPQIVEKKHVVPDDMSNGPFNRQQNPVDDVHQPDNVEVALLDQREVDVMVNNAQSSLESLGDSVRKQVADLSEIVPSNFSVWEDTDNKIKEDKVPTEEGSPWLQRLFDTADAFESGTT